MPTAKVDDVAVIWGVGTDTGRDSHLSVLSSCSLQLFPISLEEKIVAQVEKIPKDQFDLQNCQLDHADLG